MREEDFGDWPQEGPWTVKWWVTQVARTGLGPVARHETQRHENRLNDDDHSNLLHEILSEALELFACNDQLDITNFASAETLARHVQYVEPEVKKSDAKRPTDNSENFMGRARRTGGAIICPDSLKWVSERAGNESASLKEQRKAAEERALARKPGK